MINWDNSTTSRATERNRVSVPLLDLLIVVVMLTIGASGYQRVRAVRDQRASSGDIPPVAVVCSRAAQIAGGVR